MNRRPATLAPGLRTHLVVFLIYILFGIIFTLPGSLRLRSTLLGYPGDNYQHGWFLWHFAKAVSHAKNPFYTNFIYYPNKVNLAWSTTDPLTGALALPASLTASPALAYNLSLILQLALASFFARLLCLRVCGDEVAALFGGVIFGFSPFLMAQALGHLSLVTAFPIPLFLLVLTRILDTSRPGWKSGVALGGTLFLATMAHYNYTVFCCLLGVVVLIADIVVKGSAVLVRTWKAFAVAALTFLIGFLPLLRILLSGPSATPVPRGLNHVDHFSADALGFAIPSWNHLLLGHVSRNLDPRLFVAGFESTVYVGPVVLLLAVLGLWKGNATHRIWVLRTAIAGAFFWALSLGPKIHFWGHESGIPGPAAVLYRIRFAEFVSAPARFHVVVALCLAILGSVGVAYLRQRFKETWRRHALVSALAVLLLADYLTIPFPRSSIIDPAAPSDVAVTQACVLPTRVRGGTILTFPLVIAPYCMKSMWMQASDGGKYALIDGYLSYSPSPTWTEFWKVRMIRSLLSIEGLSKFPVDEAADRESAPTAVRDLDLRAFVVFDSPQSELGIDYAQAVFGVAGTKAGSCTVFELGPQ